MRKRRYKMRSFRLFVLVLLSVVDFLQSAELPSFLHVCNRNDPNLEKCVIEAVEQVRPHLKTGVPEFNIPSLEPLEIKDLLTEEIAGMHIYISNVKAFGCADFIVQDIKIIKDQHYYLVELLIDLVKLRIEADFMVDGKLLMVPVKGSGNMEVNVTDCIATDLLQGEIYEENGEQKLGFTSNKLAVKLGATQVRIDNLFNNDKLILGVINDIVNKNLDIFLKELLPAIEKGLSFKFLEISNDIVKPYTFDQLLPQ